jgi:hypothetical protein
MSTFSKHMRDDQIRWRRANLPNQSPGRYNGRYYEHILPWKDWELNLWPGIPEAAGVSLPGYLKKERIRKHTGAHNLLSSWALTANLYFPFREQSGRELLAGFLREAVTKEIKVVTRLELEYESEDPILTPLTLLGETDGGRGAGQTSPDVAFIVDTDGGPGLILVESKFTEHNFYPCSGRKKNPSGRPPNPNRARCLNARKVAAQPSQMCHLPHWGRLYWNHLGPVINFDNVNRLLCCPAAFSAYQLFRQQALAEGIAASGKFALVVSSVAFDARNTELMTCASATTGIPDVRTNWGDLFAGKTHFITFTHQAWVDWVTSQAGSEWEEWVQYTRTRYGLV